MYSMYAYPSTIRDVDPQTGVARMVGGEEMLVRVAVTMSPEPRMTHPVEFDDYSRPDTAMQAAAISVQAQMGRFEK